MGEIKLNEKRMFSDEELAQMTYRELCGLFIEALYKQWHEWQSSLRRKNVLEKENRP